MSGPIQRRSITLLTRPHSAGELPAVLRRPRRVLAHAALEKLDAVRLEGERVRADAVEEPTVVRDDERAASEVLQRKFRVRVHEMVRRVPGHQYFKLYGYIARVS